MKKKLTPKSIDALPPATGKRYEVHDTLLPGLHLRVSATGGKVFGVSRRVDGRMKRIRIGAYPIVSLADAREKARDILSDIELGQYDETSPSVAELDRDAALQEAIAANRSKTQFLANMSHELRTPLNAIIGFSEIMKTEAFGPLGSEQYVGYSTDIEDSGRHLLSIVNDILDVARIETGDFSLNEDELEVEDLLQTVKRLTEGWPAAKDRIIKIETAVDLPDLWADPRLTKQMVLNLLSNAVKFSPSGSTILLKASMNDNGAIRVDVCDQGIGIPEESIPKLTDAFYQVDARLEREFEGSGLGLTLVQKHMSLHQGTLSFESEEDIGTTATLTFPADRSIGLDEPATDKHSA